MKRQAFTLIELLVVIAIIAILAAILFPVFAQAKNAAKGAASISNSKQIGTSAFMYSADYDDMNILEVAWGTPGAPVSYGANYSPWSWLMLPYMKSWAIFADPQAPAGRVWGIAGIQKDIEKVIEPQYGYNQSYLCPAVFDPSVGYQFQAKSQTNGEDVANTVMFTSKFSSSEDNFPGPSWIWYFGNGPTTPTIIDPVKCVSELWQTPAGGYTACFGDWGRLGGSATGFTGWWGFLKNVPAAGAATGGSSLRGANNSVTMWLDGHASKASAGSLASGTNWTPTITTAPVINDRTKMKHTLIKQ
jgi:prepilin-type N-terminal cleavage/methylation domain-containing protein